MSLKRKFQRSIAREEGRPPTTREQRRKQRQLNHRLAVTAAAERDLILDLVDNIPDYQIDLSSDDTVN